MIFYIRENSLVDMKVLIQASLLVVHRSNIWFYVTYWQYRRCDGIRHVLPGLLHRC